MGFRNEALAAGVAAFVAAGIAIGAAAQEPDGDPPLCGSSEIAHGTVKRVIDGRSLLLADGREVRLAAIEVPLPAATPSPNPAGGAAETSRETLEALAGGDEVSLRGDDSATDRYGRIVAFAYALRDGDALFVQGELIASGAAQVAARVGSRACAAELWRREQEAREAKRGLWADPAYGALDATAPADVLTRQGRFALVEGQVISVHESGPTIYLNFGRHWSEEFVATVRKRDEKNFAAAGLDLAKLAGRRLLVRGFVEARGATGQSASIAADRPEQIDPTSSE